MASRMWRLGVKGTVWAVSVMVLGLVTFAIAVLVVVPRATHGTALTVLTGSMTPGIPVGSAVIDRPVDPATLRVGDIATYQVAPGEAEYITHRIVKIDTSKTPVEFTFKGDANRGPDINPVPAAAIRGKVWFHVPYLGAIRDGLHGKGGLTLVAMLVLAGYAIMQASSAFDDRKKSRTLAKGVTGPAPIRIDRTLVVATLDTEAIEAQGQTPEQIAQRWGALVLAENVVAFQLLIAPPPDGARAALELLETFHPLAVEVFEAPVMLAESDRTTPAAREPQPIGSSGERRHAAG